MRKRAYVFLVLTIAIAALIVFTSTNTEAAHSEAGGRIIGWFNTYIFGGRLTDMEKDAIVGVGAKLFGHFGLFLLDGLFGLLFVNEIKYEGKKKYMGLILFGLVLSCVGEIVQIFSEGRTPSVSDVLLDYSGFLLIPFATYLYKQK